MAVTGKMNIPIVLIIYNRPDYTYRLLKCFKRFRFNKLYIISDGPKDNHLDINLVKKTRSLINQKIKTKKVIKIYSKFNLGLRNRIITGLNEVFKKEKSAKLRNAKIRLSNLKPQEIAQVMRNKSKWIKH